MDRVALRMLGTRVRDLRKEKGLSQEELGEKAGFHFSYIGGVERAEKNITMLNLEKIADALGVTVNQLFLYGRHLQTPQSEKDTIINIINEQLSEMSITEIKKAQRLLKDLFT